LVRSGALPLDQDRAATTSLAVPVMGWRYRWGRGRGVLHEARPAVRAIRPADRGEEAFVRAYRDAIEAWWVARDPVLLHPFRGTTALGIVPDDENPFGRHVSYRLVTSPGALAALIEAGELTVDRGARSEKGPDDGRCDTAPADADGDYCPAARVARRGAAGRDLSTRPASLADHRG
jgi:hypothetical protein